MKKLEAIIRHFKLEEVRNSLVMHGLTGMTVSEVRGCGRENRPVETYRGIAHNEGYVSKVKIEVVLPDDELDRAVEAVRTAAYTGRIGDGKIFITDLCNVVSIRTGEEHLAGVA